MPKTNKKIIVNENGRRILIIDEILDIDNITYIKETDFDVLFLHSAYTTYEKNYQAIISIHPLLANKCWFKPIFITNKLEGKIRLLQNTIDGFAINPTEQHITYKIEDIYENVSRLRFPKNDTDSVLSPEQRLIHQCQYMISRNQFLLTPILTDLSDIAYASPFVELFERQGLVTFHERNSFYERLLELGYISKKRFIDKLYICPECMHSYLIFVETCPKCGNSDIEEEAVLHHFRCANISPETTYLHEGQLRCPKCHHWLRHIGVDYDRPANLFNCKACKNRFTSSKMKVTCTHCHKSFSPSQLAPFDVYEYEFTNKGVSFFASNEIINGLR